MKSEPGEYSYTDLERDQQEHWDGVRNYQARNNMKAMKKGDQVLFYHSIKDKAVVGIMKVVEEYYQDPTTDDDRWVVVDVAPVRALPHPVTLATIKETPALADMPLIKQSRLSVMPLSKKHFDTIVQMGS